ncbi:MAG TPA: radical SAM protein [Syntrophomonadaceae bacterium]|nr:radical SAM protein [Syntrophomonadaceae bacterium]
MFRTLFANEKGEICDDPMTGMLGRSGNEWVEPSPEEMMPLPGGSTLVLVPGHFPVGIGGNGETCALQADPYQPDQRAWAVAALLPQGFTRTLIPACVGLPDAPELPILGYAAVGLKGEQTYVAAIQSDEHRKWHPIHYNTEGLPQRITAFLKRCADNRIYKQLARCALRYSCFTAQNIFYQRWEGGIPTMPSCNARCLGCISERHGMSQAPQNRLDFIPDAREISEVAINHLSKARDGIISFGQGCEGEPSLNAHRLADAIRITRQHTEKGTINMNSNAGNTTGVKLLCDAGLQALRVTIFSGREENYNRYHEPVGYGLSDVLNSICYARDKGVFVSLNLLVFPGFTDRESEMEALLSLIQKGGVNMIQLRNLNIDPGCLMENFPSQEAGMGMAEFLHQLRLAAPDLRLGSYTHSPNEKK